MMISWTVSEGAGQLMAAGSRRIGTLRRPEAYDHAHHVADAIERALLDLTPSCEPLPLALFEEARRG